MNQHRYHLEKYKSPSSRYVCPGCGMARKFSRYVDGETGGYLGDHVGRCDRQDSCGYHFTPRMFFDDHPELRSVDGFRGAGMQMAATRRFQLPPVTPAAKVSYVPVKHFSDSWVEFGSNNFIQYLYENYPERSVNLAIVDYLLGTSYHWEGATVFWQMDREERLRTGKVMLYDRATGHRVRQPFSHITWAHSALRLEDFHLQQCLFGEHLLGIRSKQGLPVAICESEKTAVIASMLVPQYLWMATGGKEMLHADKLEPLRGRRVILYPDAGAYDQWRLRAKAIERIVPVSVSRIMEGRAKGMDIADYLSAGV